jgi:hypothetical protein
MFFYNLFGGIGCELLHKKKGKHEEKIKTICRDGRHVERMG